MKLSTVAPLSISNYYWITITNAMQPHILILAACRKYNVNLYRIFYLILSNIVNRASTNLGYRARCGYIYRTTTQALTAPRDALQYLLSGAYPTSTSYYAKTPSVGPCLSWVRFCQPSLGRNSHILSSSTAFESNTMKAHTSSFVIFER